MSEAVICAKAKECKEKGWAGCDHSEPHSRDIFNCHKLCHRHHCIFGKDLSDECFTCVPVSEVEIDG